MTTVTSMQQALAAEHATIYGYGVAAVHLSPTDQAAALRALTAHQLIRDRLIALITAAGSKPVAALGAYRLPRPVIGEASARELAGHLEQGCAGTFWDLVAASTAASSIRTVAVGWLGVTAERAAYWGADQALPGQPS